MATINVSERMLQPVTNCLTPEVAHRIVSSRLDAETLARIDELAAKANRGTLTEEERNEYSQVVEYIDLLGIIKAKATLLLALIILEMLLRRRPRDPLPLSVHGQGAFFEQDSGWR